MSKHALKLSVIYGTIGKVTLLRTPEFLEWMETLNTKERVQIDARLERIQDYGHFGDSKALGNDLFELRWKNGKRIYFFAILLNDKKTVYLLLGGNKNGQKKDIRKARVLLERYSSA